MRDGSLGARREHGVDHLGERVPELARFGRPVVREEAMMNVFEAGVGEECGGVHSGWFGGEMKSRFPSGMTNKKCG